MVFEQVIASIGIFIGELYGNFVGGGSIVTQFFLQNLLSIELKNAIALDNAAVLGSEIALFLSLWRNHKVTKPYIFFALGTVVGSYLGVWALYLIPLNVLKVIFVSVLVLVVTKILLLGKPRPEQVDQPMARTRFLLFIVFSVFLGAYNAFLSIGDFVIGLNVLMFLFHFSYQRSLFILAFALVFGRSFASLYYVRFGLVELSMWTPMFFSAMLAGAISGNLVQRVNSDKMGGLLKTLGVLLASYLAYDLLIH